MVYLILCYLIKRNFFYKIMVPKINIFIVISYIYIFCILQKELVPLPCTSTKKLCKHKLPENVC